MFESQLHFEFLFFLPKMWFKNYDVQMHRGVVNIVQPKTFIIVHLKLSYFLFLHALSCT